MTSTYIAELGTGDDSSPALALSLLRNRVKGIVFHHEGGVLSVGTAWDFELREVRGNLALCCRVELDDEAHDAIKHLLADGVQKLWVSDHPIVGAVGP